jgi:hypothetical protein
MNKISIIIDASILASVLLGGSIRKEFIILLGYLDKLDIYYCNKIIAEIAQLSKNDYFIKKGLTEELISDFIDTYRNFAIQANLTSNVKICRDENDNYLFSLARDTHSDFLLSSDKDVLTIRKYNQTTVLSLSEFIEHINKG